MKHHYPPILYTEVKTLDNILIWQRFGEKQAHFYVIGETVNSFEGQLTTSITT